MDTSQLASLADQVRALPVGSTGRDRRLHRLVDLLAAADAASALKEAAAVAEPGSAADLFVSASAILSLHRDEASAFIDDDGAYARLREAVTSPWFHSHLPEWVFELRELAAVRPDTGACTLATGLQLWTWTTDHFRAGRGADAASAARATDELAEALCPMLAARALVLQVAGRSPDSQPERGHRADLCHVYAAHAAASLGAVCAELVFGYRRHLTWDAEGCAACYGGQELDDLEGLIPGMATGARAATDVVEADGTHAAKAGPCVRFDGVETFTGLRSRLDGCLSGARLARERAAETLGRPTAGSGTTSAGRL